MPAPKGHPLWGNPLKPKKYTPEQLWEGACGYFEKNSEKKWKKQDFIRGGESAGMKVELETENPYSIEGLCIYIDISKQTFYNYESCEDKTYFDVCARIRDIINRQHFEGGMVGAFNANIVTRKLGLEEKISQRTEIVLRPNDDEEAEELRKLKNDE